MKTTEPDDKQDGPAPAGGVRWLFSSKDSPEFVDAFAAIEADAQAFARQHQGKVSRLSGEQLGLATEEYEKICARVECVSAFVTLTVAADAAERAWGHLMRERLAFLHRRLMFFPLEINQLKEPDLLDKIFAPRLMPYRSWIGRTRALRDHQLDGSVEEYMHEKYMVAEGAWMRLFRMTHADMRFNLRGKVLTGAQMQDAMAAAGDPALRREAYAEYGRVLGQNKKVFGLIVNTLAEMKQEEDESRDLENPMDGPHLYHQLPSEAIAVMLRAIRDSYPRQSHRYYAWKAKKSGVARLHPADCSAAMPGSVKKDCPWAVAKRDVLGALRAFSPELADAGQQLFDQNRIDAEQRPGKDRRVLVLPGAYISMSYEGSSSDANVLAQALGRGVHHTLAAGRGSLQSAPALPLMEASGVFAGLLAFQHRFDREEDLAVRRDLLAEHIEGLLNTVVRQTTLFLFENRVQQERRDMGEISPERLSVLWRETQKDGFGASVNFDADGAESFWMETPYFMHDPSCAPLFGVCFALALHEAYAASDDKPGFARKYADFLKEGGMKRPETVLEAFGFDINDPQFWKRGVSVLERRVAELVALDQKIELLQKTKKDFNDAGCDGALPPPPPPEKKDPRPGPESPKP